MLGMHRSGTSALSGVMGLMGADAPGDLAAGTEMNAKGFFESNIVTQLNEDLLAAANTSWWDCRNLPREWLQSEGLTQFGERAKIDIEREFGQSSLFFLKDPRICRLLPFWLPALEAAGITPLVVHTHRHPMDVARSLQRWWDYDPEYSQILWLRHVLDAEADSRGMARVFTNFDEVLDDWRVTVGKISDGLGFDWPRDLQEAAPELDDFLTGELRHFSTPASEPLPDWVATVYAVLERWVTEGEQASDYAVLDAINEKVREASANVAGLAENAQGLFSAGKLARQAHADLAAERDRLVQSLGDLTARNEALQQQKEALDRDLEEREQALSELRADYEKRTAALQSVIESHEFRLDQQSVKSIALTAERDALRERGQIDAKTLAQLEHTVAALYGSTSWRVSAPLRAASRLVKKIKPR
ncbi:sulfotransferase family protein [Paracoccus cavernae]|uniref:sulfotransferase family protein n=1 Tax=Paracoccus cavernae TaxID=1571207 RepID=UPI0036192483